MPRRTFDLRLFFCTDIHGSNLCFRKLLAAKAFYGADVIILGGDLTGKMIVPICKVASGWEANYLSSRVRLETESATQDFEKLVSDAGYYPFRTTGELLRQADGPWQRQVFREQVLNRLQMWDELAGARFPIYVAPGNDDEEYIDALISQSMSFVNVEATEVELPSGYKLYSSGWSNPTPWRTPRELNEVDLLRRFEGMFAGVTEFDKAVFNFHVPPKDTGLDSCFEVNDRLEVVTELGQPKLIGAGSLAVRELLRRFQPLASLHGHIHESRGMYRLGRTQAFNPGSEYSEGILRGVLLNLGSNRVVEYLFTSG
jgi:Icc-related predicted phosphoesterase